MDKPLISLVIPVYNTAKYLDKCIQSAVVQQYSNLEIVIVNNGSTDNSQEIIDKYASIDNRIKAYTIQHVPTVKESKDNCYRRASGDWVITLDSDDAISLDYVDTMWNAHVRTGADMVIAQRQSVDEDGNGYDLLPLETFDFSISYTAKEALQRTIVKWEMSVNGALVTKKNLYNIMLHNPACKIYTDEYDSRILLRHAEQVSFCRARYFYTFNPNSVGKKDNWNRHRYRLKTRLGLLDVCSKEFGIKSSEYQNVVTQAVGISLLAIKHYLSNKTAYTLENKIEFKDTVASIIENIEIKGLNLRNLMNISSLVILKIIFTFI